MVRAWWTSLACFLWCTPLGFLAACDCSSVPWRQLCLHSRSGSFSGPEIFILQIFLSPETHWQIYFHAYVLAFFCMPSAMLVSEGISQPFWTFLLCIYLWGFLVEMVVLEWFQIQFVGRPRKVELSSGKGGCA